MASLHSPPQGIVVVSIYLLQEHNEFCLSDKQRTSCEKYHERVRRVQFDDYLM